MTDRIAIVGTGLVGSGWTIVFARAGCEVALWDNAPGAAARARDGIARSLDDLVEAGLLDAAAPALACALRRHSRMRSMAQSMCRRACWSASM